MYTYLLNRDQSHRRTQKHNVYHPLFHHYPAYHHRSSFGVKALHSEAAQQSNLQLHLQVFYSFLLLLEEEYTGSIACRTPAHEILLVPSIACLALLFSQLCSVKYDIRHSLPQLCVVCFMIETDIVWRNYRNLWIIRFPWHKTFHPSSIVGLLRFGFGYQNSNWDHPSTHWYVDLFPFVLPLSNKWLVITQIKWRRDTI